MNYIVTDGMSARLFKDGVFTAFVPRCLQGAELRDGAKSLRYSFIIRVKEKRGTN